MGRWSLSKLSAGSKGLTPPSSPCTLGSFHGFCKVKKPGITHVGPLGGIGREAAVTGPSNFLPCVFQAPKLFLPLAKPLLHSARARVCVCVCVCVCVYTLKNTSLSALVYQHNHRANPHLHTSLSLDSSTPSMPSSITCHHQICVRLVPGQPSFPSLFPLSEEIGDS